ncbi:MAG: hypothetical protein H6865_01295 [Rhodospirillales bacterium]|nr:hypothetical protein [Rhodospirillales bacterium]
MTLWRPLLASHTHADLVAYCREHGLAWIEDPTNANDKYARNRLRMALRGEGLNDTRLDATLRRIERAADTLRLLSDRLATRASVAHDDAAWVFDLNALRTEPFELALRVLRRAVDEQAGAAGYGARLDRLEDLARELLESPAATARTLGGCVLRVDPHAGTLSVAAEIPAQAAKTLPLAANGL